MKSLMVVSAVLVLVACSSHGRDDASKCGVTEVQLREAIGEVSGLEPYSGKRLGRCNLIVDDARDVLVITPEIQQSVQNMIAREKAGSKS